MTITLMSIGIFYGWWVVLACFIIGFYVSGTIFYGFTAFFEPLVKEFGWSYTQISIATSLRGLEMGILAPLVGLVADRLGSRKVIFAGIILSGLGFIVLSMTTSLLMFYCAILFLALGAGGCASLVLISSVANWFDRDVGKALGVVACGIGASGLSVPLIVWMVDTYQWRTTLVILGVGLWILGIPLSLVIRNKPEDYGYLPDGESKTTSGPKVKERVREINFREILKNRSFWYINLVETIRFMAISAVIVHVMPYLASVGMQRRGASLVAAAIPLFSIIGRLSFGWLADTYDKRHVMAFAFCIMVLGMLAFSYAHILWLIFVFLFLYSPAYGGGMVLRGAILRQYFGRASFGKVLGITMGSASLGGIIGPAMAGWTYDTFGSYYYAWLVLCGFLGLAVGLIAMIKPAAHGDQREPAHV